MQSGNWLSLGISLVVMALFLNAFTFFDYHDLEYKREKAVSDYFNGEISREDYNDTMEYLKGREDFIVIVNLGNTILLYSGLLMAIVGAYKKSEENSEELRNFFKRFQRDKPL